jgi:putative YhbY family RNA-binding protein
MHPLSPKRRSELRSEAHKLNPTVIIGDKGLTDEVVAEIDRALKAHELIKVRAATDDRDARNVWMESICEKLEAHPVQQIGKVLVVYRENPERHVIPAKAGIQVGSRLRGNDEKVKRTSRPRSRTPSPRPASEPRRRRPRTSR